MDLEDDAEQAIARAKELHLVGMVALVDVADFALRCHEAQALHVGADLAVAAGEGGVLGGGGRHGAEGDVADLGGDVELQAAILQSARHSEVIYAGLHGYAVRADAQNAVHGLHIDHGAAYVAVHAGGRVHRSRRAHGRREANNVLQDLDEVFGAVRRDQHLGAVSPGAVPALDRNVVLYVHKIPR